ncbi:MAG: flagellar basal body protein [Verrucomicrobiota bacterium]|jgi:flagellar basal-body rod protein FlgB
MIDALFNQPAYLAAKKMLDATVLRQEAIASNLSNLETPNYKRLDVSPTFESQLSQAVGGQDAAKITGLKPSLAVDTTAVSGRSDGNTVTLESEMLKLNQNTVEDALETELIGISLANMRLAITGKS